MSKSNIKLNLKTSSESLSEKENDAALTSFFAVLFEWKLEEVENGQNTK